MKRTLFAGVCLVALAGCEKSTEPSSAAGTVSFTYTGAGGGTFSAIGVPPANPDIGNSTTDWAAGHLEAQITQTSVAGVHLRGAGRYDAVILFAERLTAGSSSVDAGCEDIESTDCTGVVFLANGLLGDEGTFGLVCALWTGSVVITEVSATRVKGTFSGSGECVDQFDVTAFTVTGGTFDVPLVALP